MAGIGIPILWSQRHLTTRRLVMSRKNRIDGGFIIIPNNTILCKQFQELDIYSRMVYIVILTEFTRDKRLNPEHTVKITHRQIEEKTGISHSQVVRAMKSLKEEEFIFVEKQGGLYGKQNYSIYKLNARYLY